ncbi:MAG TPA: carboxypeptidase-like regulatory domain-containing protein [Gaiellales bacterium]|jgi:hypothetical protein|nr:carboxypeptidase-like regulatory domain-containing protein [Gaiellales bacterium]
MRRGILVAVIGALVVMPIVVFLVARSRRPAGAAATGRVSYAQVQTIFNASCVGCHPSVNPSLDLTAGHSYGALVNTRALEDPNYVRVAVGDPEKSFLYLKVAGFGQAAQIGGRMPLRANPLPTADVRLIADWIREGARGPDGRRPPTSTLPLPGEPNLPNLAQATTPTGTGTITGTVVDEARNPIAGALVTLLLRGPDQPGGEEHYRVAVTDSTGHFTLDDAPAGRFELKAYAPNTIYVSHIVALDPGGTATLEFGLPNRAIDTPKIGDARVAKAAAGGESLSMTVNGANLDPNYTLAVNPGSGRVFELHRPGATAGTWRASIDHRLPGKWVFLAVDRLCEVSSFITARAA